MAHEKFLDLSYGENPHQKAALYVEVGARSHVLSRVAKLHGRALSFNNVLDLDAARRLLDELEQAACVIVKHNNPCGVAVAEQIGDAYEKALACDPLSAFGGVIALNRPVDRALAERLHERFIEVLIAPAYDEDALEVLKQKEAVRLLEATEQRSYEPRERDVKRVRGGLLVQDPDRIDERRESMQVVTQGQARTESQWEDLWFAWKVCRHVRSNAIVIAKDGATLGIGAGQMSRVDSVRIAIEKARLARGEEADGLLAGSVVASDAFFPFPDGPQLAIDAGVDGAGPAGGIGARLGGDRRLRRGGRGDGVHGAPALPALARPRQQLRGCPLRQWGAGTTQQRLKVCSPTSVAGAVDAPAKAGAT